MFGVADGADRVEIPVEGAVETDRLLPLPRPPCQKAQGHPYHQHEEAHDYAGRSEDPRVPGESHPRRIVGRFLVLSWAAVRSSWGRTKIG